MKISKKMTIKEIREAFRIHGCLVGWGWEIILFMLFESNNADEAELEGYGINTEIHFITKTEAAD